MITAKALAYTELDTTSAFLAFVLYKMSDPKMTLPIMFFWLARSGMQGRMWIEDTNSPATAHEGLVSGRADAWDRIGKLAVSLMAP